jgi:ATP synthase protein I
VTENSDRLQKEVDLRVQRLQSQSSRNGHWVRETRHLGTLSLLMVMPIIGGAYLGLFLDKKSSGYSIYFTIAGLLLGVAGGLTSVFLFLKRTP